MNQRRSKSKLSLDKAVSDGCVHTEWKVFPFHLKEGSEERKKCELAGFFLFSIRTKMNEIQFQLLTGAMNSYGIYMVTDSYRMPVT